MSEKLTVISDHIGRIVAGVIVGETETTLTLKNPIGVYTNFQQGGGIQVQTMPYVLMEIVSPESRKEWNWTFQKAAIAVSDVQLDEKLTSTILNIPNVAVGGPNPGAPAGDAKIVSLFD